MNTTFKKIMCIIIAVTMTATMLILVACTPVNDEKPADAVQIDFYGINDLHGKFVDNDGEVGVASLTTYLKKGKTANPNSIFLSSGDMWQGGSESNITEGRIITDWMNHVGFASMTLGNHEFDWGADAIIANDNLANFPILAINVYNTSNNTRVSYAQPSVVVETGGVKIGIIGAIGDVKSSIESSNVAGITFRTGAELTTLVKDEADRLRNQGVDFVVYSIHDGHTETSGTTVDDNTLSEYYDISLSRQYVDLVYEGHTHQTYIQSDSKGVYHVQGGGYNSGIVKTSAFVSPTTSKVYVEQPTLVRRADYSGSNSDPIVQQLLTKYDDEIGHIHDVLGYNSFTRDSSELSSTVAMLYSELATHYPQYNVVLGGGSVNARSPYYLYAGSVTYAKLDALFPFTNRIALCSISGKDLAERFFDNSSYSLYFTEYGNRIINQIEFNTTYYIITDAWNYNYSSNNLTVVEYYTDGVYAKDLLAQYARANGFD